MTREVVIKSLSEKELELMSYLWNIRKGYLKDIVSQYKEPKPAYTTISTTLNRMIDKKYIGFLMRGRDKEYFPLLKKKNYFSSQINKMVKNYFNESTSQFASFFTKDTKLTIEELEELRKLVDLEIKKKTNK